MNKELKIKNIFSSRKQHRNESQQDDIDSFYRSYGAYSYKYRSANSSSFNSSPSKEHTVLLSKISSHTQNLSRKILRSEIQSQRRLQGKGATTIGLIPEFRLPAFNLWIFLCIALGLLLSSLELRSMSNYKFSLPNVTLLSDKLIPPSSGVVMLGEKIIETGSESSDGLDNYSEVSVSTYTLQYGDFLINVAKKHNLYIDTLISWNNIKDARRVRAGDDIIIPNKNGILHKVSRGDTISSISQKYNIKATEILDANNLETSVLDVGSRLFIPNAKMDEFELGLVLGTVFLTPTRGYISSGYGYRISPISGKYHFHGAVDIAGKRGTPVNAAGSGIVTYVTNNNPTYGKMVIVKHAGGFQTMYAHLDKIYVRKGQRLGRGRTIGLMGNTGLSTGPHLHFVVILNGKTVNPLRYIHF